MANDVLDTLIAEAYAEGPEGMRRVAETILNRAAIRGITPEEVVRQARQYTGYENPGPAAVRAQQTQKAQQAAQAAWELALQPGDPTGGADHYFNPNVVQPGWASSMQPKGEYGNHAFYASRPIPPGELPEVASLTDTRRPAPLPVTPTPDMSLMRANRMPTQLIPDTFASLARPGQIQGRSIGDDIAMNPVQGGKQSLPMFDAAYDTRLGQMQMLSEPVLGPQVGASRAPAPMPVQQSPQLSATRARDPQLQAALNARYPAQLPPIPSPIGQPPATRSVQSVAVAPSRPQVSASDLARGRSGISTIATIPTTSRTAIPQSFAGMERAPSIPDRLAPGLPGMPAIYGDFLPEQVAQIGVPAVPVPGFPTTRVANGAPMPFPRPSFTGVGTMLDVARLPPLPIPRPQMPTQQPRRVAPVPMARPQTTAPLRITVNGANPIPQQLSPVAQFRNAGMSPADAYEAANRAAAERARERAGTSERSDYFKMATGG